jgi:hypothetical protein
LTKLYACLSAETLSNVDDRTTTVKLNRPRSISQGIITVSLPYEVPSIDRRQKFDNIQHQIADARLALILDHVSEVR